MGLASYSLCPPPHGTPACGLERGGVLRPAWANPTDGEVLRASTWRQQGCRHPGCPRSPTMLTCEHVTTVSPRPHHKHRGLPPGFMGGPSRPLQAEAERELLDFHLFPLARHPSEVSPPLQPYHVTVAVSPLSATPVCFHSAVPSSEALLYRRVRCARRCCNRCAPVPPLGLRELDSPEPDASSRPPKRLLATRRGREVWAPARPAMRSDVR